MKCFNFSKFFVKKKMFFLNNYKNFWRVEKKMFFLNNYKNFWRVEGEFFLFLVRVNNASFE